MTTQVCSAQLTAPSMTEPTASILIGDDEKALRLVLSRAMEKEGYHTITASSGERCLFLCQQQLPDLILLDAVMPGMDGFECCQQLVRLFGDRCPPILMITALHDPASVDKAFAAGASDFITKPIHWAVLRQRVQQTLKNHQLTAKWQAALVQEELLKNQLEAERQKVKQLTKLCQTNGIETGL